MSKIITFPRRVEQKAIALWIEEFEAYYFTCRARTPKSETTWMGDYAKVFKTLPKDQRLSPEILTAAVMSTKPDSRTRKRYCIALGALAKFAGLTVDLKAFSGVYSSKLAQPRDLPDDATITAQFDLISSPCWRWAYGMLAAYGLRPHELFHLDHARLQSSGVAQVLDGKTGARLVFPYYPEWVESWDLKSIQVPKVTGSSNTELGSRVTQAFRRLGAGFPAYSLRHCWAIRTLEFGLDLSLAAQQMGHSVGVHTDLYHRWISERRQEKAFEALLQRTDRPKPPQEGVRPACKPIRFTSVKH